MRQMTRSETSEKVTAGANDVSNNYYKFLFSYLYFVKNNLLYFDVLNEATIQP